MLDRRGRMVNLRDHVIAESDGYLLAEPEFKAWIKSKISYG